MKKSTLIAIITVVLLLFLSIWGISCYRELSSDRIEPNKANAEISSEISSLNVVVPELTELTKSCVADTEAYSRVSSVQSQKIDTTNTTALFNLYHDLESAVNKITVSAEQNDPAIKENPRYVAVSRRLQLIEDRVADMDAKYAATVQAYNQKLGEFPYNVVAHIMHLSPEESYATENILTTYDIAQEKSAALSIEGDAGEKEDSDVLFYIILGVFILLFIGGIALQVYLNRRLYNRRQERRQKRRVDSYYPYDEYRKDAGAEPSKEEYSEAQEEAYRLYEEFLAEQEANRHKEDGKDE